MQEMISKYTSSETRSVGLFGLAIRILRFGFYFLLFSGTGFCWSLVDRTRKKERKKEREIKGRGCFSHIRILFLCFSPYQNHHTYIMHRQGSVVAARTRDTGLITACTTSSENIEKEGDGDGREKKEEKEEKMDDEIFSEERMVNLKNSIEVLSKEHQIKILQLLKEDTTTKINSNKSGVYINLSKVSPRVLVELDKYTRYANDQEQNLKIHEVQKSLFHESFFSGNHHVGNNTTATVAAATTTIKKSSINNKPHKQQQQQYAIVADSSVDNNNNATYSSNNNNDSVFVDEYQLI